MLQQSTPSVSSLSSSKVKLDKRLLRKKVRQQRRCLSVADQRKASRHLSTQLNRSRLLLKHRFIALYLGSDGELDPEIMIKKLWQQKKQVYLPVIQPFSKNTLFFCQVKPNTKLIKNKFGILEPELKTTPRIGRKFLSLVLMPLVAFDNKGNRMGMGGGFYDRSFAYKGNKSQHSLPKLVGIAHHFQEHPNLPTEPWDVPLDAVLTDKDYFRFN